MSCAIRRVADEHMVYQANKFDCREVLSLIVALLSLLAIVFYHIFWRDYSGYTFDLTADAVFRLLVVPMASISIPFLLSSRFVVIRVSVATLRTVKAVCLGIISAYVLCVVILMLVDNPSSYEIRSVA